MITAKRDINCSVVFKLLAMLSLTASSLFLFILSVQKATYMYDIVPCQGQAVQICADGEMSNFKLRIRRKKIMLNVFKTMYAYATKGRRHPG